MDAENNWLDNLGGRKWLLSLVVTGAIVGMAIKNPASLTTEVIIGLLGVIAAYSGSNAVLTGLAMRGQSAKANPVEAAPSIQEEGASPEVSLPSAEPETLPRDNYMSLSAELAELQTRMSQNEKTTAEIIDIIKQMMAKK